MHACICKHEKDDDDIAGLAIHSTLVTKVDGEREDEEGLFWLAQHPSFPLHASLSL